MRRRGTSRKIALLTGAATVVAACGLSGAGPALADVPQPDCGKIYQRKGSGFYEDNPVYVDRRNDSAEWKVSTPKAEGLDGKRIKAGVAYLARTSSLTSVIVMRHGKLVTESYFHGGAVNKARNIHSSSKGVIQALVGIAVSERRIGGLNDPISKYLPATYFTGPGADKKNITIRHLLTMSSGIAWKEDTSEKLIEKQPDWVRAILARPLAHRPGTTFTYGSDNTHLLSAILQRATGMNTCRYAETRLFSKINITPEHWGRDPQGVYSGGYNLYLTPREMAKFGQLYLNGGRWNGRQVVPRVTVQQAATTVLKADKTYSYSSGWWKQKIRGVDIYFGWGFGGQFLYVIPSLDVVFATTQDTSPSADGQEVDEVTFVRDYLLPAVQKRKGA